MINVKIKSEPKEIIYKILTTEDFEVKLNEEQLEKLEKILKKLDKKGGDAIDFTTNLVMTRIRWKGNVVERGQSDYSETVDEITKKIFEYLKFNPKVKQMKVNEV